LGSCHVTLLNLLLKLALNTNQSINWPSNHMQDS
jgi:hypothetical protein